MAADKERVSVTHHRGAAVLILAVVLTVSFGVLDNGFVNYDDPQVLLNPGAAGDLAPTYANLADRLIPSAGQAWLPLRFITFSLLYSLAGPTAWIFHLFSLVLYMILSLQVYLLAHRLLGWDGYTRDSEPWKLSRANFWPLFAALVFAVHPLNVESLAWVSAVKDLMLGVCWMGFALSIAGSDGLHLRGNRAAVIWFVIALLAKPSAVVLPVLAAAFALLGPYGAGRKEIPWKIIGAAGVLLAGYIVWLLPQIGSMEVYTRAGGAGSMLAGALKAFWAYMGSFLVPVGLSVRYLVDVSLSPLEPATLARLAGLAALCLLAGLWWKRGRRLPALALAWCLLAFLPSSGLVPLGILRADRYALTLMPMFAVALSYGFREMAAGFVGSGGRIFRAAVWVVPLCFALLFFQRAGVWQNSEQLWTDALDKDNRHWIALNGLAHWELEQGDTTGAVEFYERALDVNPNSVLALNSLALLVEKSGDKARAESLLTEAARLRDYDLETSLDLARFYLNSGQPHRAAGLLEPIDSLGVENARLHYMLSLIYNRTGHLDWSVSRMNAARALDPDNPLYTAELARLRFKQGRFEQAIYLLGQALERDPELVEAYVGYGDVFQAVGQRQDAARSYESALSRDPDNRDALLGMASLLGSSGNLDSASVVLETLRRYYPDDCLVLSNQVALEMSSGNWSEGLRVLGEAMECDSTIAENYMNGYSLYVAADSLGRAAVMLAGARTLGVEQESLAHLLEDFASKTGSPADTAIKYLSTFSVQTGRKVGVARAATIIDSLRGTGH